MSSRDASWQGSSSTTGMRNFQRVLVFHKKSACGVPSYNIKVSPVAAHVRCVSLLSPMANGPLIVTNFDDTVPHGPISWFSTTPSPVMTAYPLPLIVHHRSVFSALMPVALVVEQVTEGGA